MKLNRLATLPKKAHPDDAGYDLYSVQHHILRKGDGTPTKIPTGIAIEYPKGTYGKVAPRSSLSLRGVDVKAGVIDAGYRGEIIVLLYYNGEGEMTIAPGMKIAQIIFEVIKNDMEVQEVKNLTPTERAKQGFGSSDKPKELAKDKKSKKEKKEELFYQELSDGIVPMKHCPHGVRMYFSEQSGQCLNCRLQVMKIQEKRKKETPLPEEKDIPPSEEWTSLADDHEELLIVKLNIGRKETNALIDCGASGNYINPDFAKDLWKNKGNQGLFKKLDQSYLVKLADATTHQVTYSIKQISVIMQGFIGKENFDIAPINNHQLILGKAWLKKYNPDID